MKNISLNTCWLSSQPAMALCSKTWRNSFALRCRFPKRDASTASKLQCKISILRPIRCWSTPISKTTLRKTFCSTQSGISMLSRKRPNGLWNGWTEITVSRRDWLPSQQFKEFSSQVRFALSFGSRSVL